ncbi:alpha-amylase family glycosyl hydrolase [Massilia luteola]|uniref:alpha-amylase family glycosyl hydrolase n=1 Tax=Massilia luteola TaxID=3081751 RepID=UPI002ACC3048|nr:alpha-amylase family glycosyl hydrolase [Massilia sp. Gc5]
MTTMSDPFSAMLDALPAGLHDTLQRRLKRHEGILRERLHRLYGHLPGHDAWYAALLAEAGRLVAARPAALLALDGARERQPDWFCAPTMLGYSAYVDRFGRDLRGVAARIPHLRDLGVTYLHLLPFLKPRAGESDGGFAVASFDHVDPRLGTMDDLEDLAASLRANGMSLCSDLILNHVADDHPWAAGARAGDERLRGFFHVLPEREQVDAYERTLGQVFPDAAPGNFTFDATMGGWVWTTFYPFQWDLNYANPALFAAVAAALLRLANRGVDVFRLDSTAFLWKRPGTDCMNQPEAHTVLQALRTLVAIAAPGVLLKAEAIVPTRELPAYFGTADAPECHLAYHSTLMTAGWAALAEQDAGLVRAVVDGTPALPPHTSWVTYVRCHDDIGWKHLQPEAGNIGRLAAVADFYNGGRGFADGVAFQGGLATNGTAASLCGLRHADPEAAVRRVLLLHALALAFGGLPMLYMGDELGMVNDHDYLLDPARAHDSRWVQRAAFPADTAATGPIHAGLRRLIALRNRHPDLAAGVPCAALDTSDPALLALARGTRFLGLFNFSERAVAAAPGGRVLRPWECVWLDRATGQPLT